MITSAKWRSMALETMILIVNLLIATSSAFHIKRLDLTNDANLYKWLDGNEKNLKDYLAVLHPEFSQPRETDNIPSFYLNVPYSKKLHLGSLKKFNSEFGGDLNKYVFLKTRILNVNNNSNALPAHRSDKSFVRFGRKNNELLSDQQIEHLFEYGDFANNLDINAYKNKLINNLNGAQIVPKYMRYGRSAGRQKEYVRFGRGAIKHKQLVIYGKKLNNENNAFKNLENYLSDYNLLRLNEKSNNYYESDDVQLLNGLDADETKKNENFVKKYLANINNFHIQNKNVNEMIDMINQTTSVGSPTKRRYKDNKGDSKQYIRYGRDSNKDREFIRYEKSAINFVKPLNKNKYDIAKDMNIHNKLNEKYLKDKNSNDHIKNLQDLNNMNYIENIENNNNEEESARKHKNDEEGDYVTNINKIKTDMEDGNYGEGNHFEVAENYLPDIDGDYSETNEKTNSKNLISIDASGKTTINKDKIYANSQLKQMNNLAKNMSKKASYIRYGRKAKGSDYIRYG